MKGRLFCPLSALLLVLFGFVETATSQENLCETKKLCFPVVGTAEQPALAIETQGGFYGEGTTDAGVRKKLQGFSEIEKLAVPEYLILKELAITKTGTFDDFLANYHGEDGKKYARGIVSDFAELQKYSKTVKALSFQCKLLHGDLVRIRYQRQYDDGRQMDWSSILKKIEGRYYFVALEEEHIFHGIAEAFWHLRGRGVCKKEALTSLQGISFVAENAQYPLAAYIKPVASKKDDPLITFLNKWIKVCQEGTVDDIVACYSDGLSTTMLR